MIQREIVHVLLLPDKSIIGGTERLMLYLVDRTPQDKYRLKAMVTDSNDSLLALSLHERSVPLLEAKEIRFLSDFTGIRSTIDLLRIHAPYILHIHNPYFRANPYLPLFARMAGIRRVIVTEQNNHPAHPSALGWYRKWLMSHAVDLTVACSNAVQDTLLAQYHYLSRRVRVVPNAVDAHDITRRVSLTDPSAVRRSLGLPERAVVVGTIATFRPQKGLNYLIEAMPMVLDRVPEAIFLLVGDGELRPEIMMALHRHGLADRVVLTGWCPDVVPLLTAMDVFVLPSLFEGLPLTVLEAMAAGCPIVATRVDGTMEVIIDCQTGILVPPANAIALSEAIVYILGNKEFAKMLGQNAQKIVLTKHGLDATVGAYLALYEELGTE